MKKAVVLIILSAAFILYFNMSSYKNLIYGADIINNNGNLTLNIKSDYKEDIEPVRENQKSVYFDIKNAKLSDNFMSESDNMIIVAQEIGSRVRIYLTGEDIENLNASISANRGNTPFNKGKTAAEAVFVLSLLYLVKRSCFDTIKTAKPKITQTPVREAMSLNRQLYDMNKRNIPVIAASNMTNPVNKNPEVYVDFQYAKDRKNIKIAI